MSSNNALLSKNIATNTNKRPLVIQDAIEGSAQLASSGMLEVTDLVSAIHKEIVIRPFSAIAPNCVEDIYENTTGKVYDIIKNIMRISSETTESSLRLLNTQLPRKISKRPLPHNANALVSVLNGVMGDHLVTLENPLALPMIVYHNDKKQHNLQDLSGRIVILIHGLCMNHHCWLPTSEQGLGNKIAHDTADSTVLYLEYNTGKRISENGVELSAILTKMIDDNPKINTIDIVGHSMGGLITRSAMFYAEQNRDVWLKKLTNYVAICSPHHGAVLERLGYVFQDSIAKIPVAGNLARLGDLRSAGIIDLRHASIRHEDWQIGDRMGIPDDIRQPTPLPSNVKIYFIGASRDSSYQKDYNDQMGDGLVSLSSAMGEHTEEKHQLNIPKEHKAIFYNINHISILKLDDMHKQVVDWLNNK